MVAKFAESKNGLNWNRLEYSIKRNFGGLDPKKVITPLDKFKTKCGEALEGINSTDEYLPTTAIELIESCLSGEYSSFSGYLSIYIFLFVVEINRIC